MRELLKARGSAAMQVEKLVVVMQDRPQEFVQQLASEWEPIGTLVLTDQPIVRIYCVIDEAPVLMLLYVCSGPLQVGRIGVCWLRDPVQAQH